MNLWISSWDREVLLKKSAFSDTPWIQMDRHCTAVGDSNTAFDLQVSVHFKRRPERFALSYSNTRSVLDSVKGPFVSRTSDHTVSMVWESYPDTVLRIPIQFTAVKSDSVTETVEAKFSELIEPLTAEKPLTNIIPATTFRRTAIICRPSAGK